MKWDSPWGLCYPGWHIECSTMGRKYLGDQFDIHTGGIDLIPTHHENEIAQSKGVTNKIPAKYWLHQEFLLINGGKMSKSLGNVYLLQDIIDKGYDALTYKLFCYSSHYRNKLNFTWDAIESANKSLIKLKEGYNQHLNGNEDINNEILEEFENKFHQAINDDLNMPVAMSVVWETIKYPNKSKKIAELILKFYTVLGLKINQKINNKEEELPQEITEQIEKRKKAREEKNWKLSDEIRDELKKLGYNVKDEKDGMVVQKI